jgi:hypothetical protein
MRVDVCEDMVESECCRIARERKKENLYNSSVKSPSKVGGQETVRCIIFPDWIKGCGFLQTVRELSVPETLGEVDLS